MKRKSISNKTRFEVFKRDSFTCQYCGKKAPDVILNIDHINPVANGGDNVIINLITSCFDCNSGKKARLLSDNTTVKKQQKQIEDLNERREQLEMLMKWRDGLMNLVDMQVDKFVSYIENYIPGLGIQDPFKLEIKKWIKKYQADVIFESIDESAERYLHFKDGKATKDSAETYLGKIRGIIFYKSLPPLEQKKNWIKAIAAKKYNRNGWEFEDVLTKYISALKNYGQSDEFIMNDLQDEVRPLLNQSNSYYNFIDTIEKWVSDISGW